MPKAPLRKRSVVHPTEKTCLHCKKICPINLFELKPTELNYRNICKHCKNTNARITRRLRTKHLKKYGLPDKNHSCEVCNKKAPLVFDHCHKTSLFRGWLCRHCNAAIGKLGDDLAGIEKARAYLRHFEAASILFHFQK